MVALRINNTCAALVFYPGNLSVGGAAEPAAGSSVISHQAARRVPAAGGGRGEPQGATARLRGEGHRKAVHAREPPSPVAKVKRNK